MAKIIEEFHEFAERQLWEGKRAAYIVTSRGNSPRSGDEVQRILFENGAVSDASRHFDPPKDLRAFREMRLEYLRAVLKKEERDWEEYKAECSEQAEWHLRFPMSCPPPPSEAPDQLRKGAFRIQGLLSKIAALEEEGKDPRVEEAKRQAAELERERHSQFQQLRTAITIASI